MTNILPLRPGTLKYSPMTLKPSHCFAMTIRIALLTFALLLGHSASAAEKATIKLGVLAFGTSNWELAALENEGLLNDAGFKLDITPMANPQAGKIALQSNAVDMIITDWIWVSRMRASGSDYTFYPYSTAAGALVVPKDSPIQSIADLQGKKLGIAGGELDKNWLLLQALGLKQQINLNDSVDKAFGAPPLLNQQLIQQRLDAVINYWHFVARLEAQDYRQIIDGNGILQQLDIKESVPVLGYVFRQSWGEQHKKIVDDFLKITAKAKNRLCDSDAAWDKIASLTKAGDPATQASLRQHYCAGRVQKWDVSNQQAAGEIYTLLRQLSGNKLTGASEQLNSGTFWQLD